MKSYKLVILRSSQVIQLSLAIATGLLIVLQISLVIAVICGIDIDTPLTDNLTFGIYG